MATFVVETGSASATANSYASIADADAYIDNFVRNSTHWTHLSDADKQRYLREATQTIDLSYGSRFRGYRFSESQGLDWPRSAVTTDDGWLVGADEIPQELKDATAEMAWRHLADSGPSNTTGNTTGVIPDRDEGKNIIEEDISVGSIRTKTKYSGSKTVTKKFRKVELLLRKYLNPAGEMFRA
jgi:hypothetical protein